MNILILAHNRLESFKHLLSSCMGIKDAKIWISVDKGNSNKNHELINYIEKIHDGSNFFYQISEKNLGVRDGVYFGIDWFFESVENGVILEEDLILNNKALEYLFKNDEIKDIDILNLSCFDNSEVNKNSINLSKVQDFYMWGWISKKSVWNEFKNYRSKSIFNYFPHKFFIKTGFLSYFQWLFISILLKKNHIDSWGYRFLFFTIFKNKSSYRTSPPVAVNNGLDEGANYTKLTLKRKNLINRCDKNLLEYDVNQSTYLYRTDIEKNHFLHAHKTRHNISLYQALKAFLWIVFPIRIFLKNLFK